MCLFVCVRERERECVRESVRVCVCDVGGGEGEKLGGCVCVCA